MDIESINVLKGTSAGVLYGSQGSNGVLIVTTKKGLPSQKFAVGLNSTTVFEEVSYMPDFQYEFGMGIFGEYDPRENTNWGPRYDEIPFTNEPYPIGPVFEDGSSQAVPFAPVKDNLRDFFVTGNTFQNTLYLSGGGSNSSFYLSIGDQSTTGVVPDDSYDRNTFRVNASQTLGNVTLNLNSTYMTDKTSVVGDNLGYYGGPLISILYSTPTNIPLTDYKDWDNPESYAYADNYFNAYVENPYWAVGTSRNNDSTERLLANIQLSWDIKDWLNLITRLGINSSNGNGKNFRYSQSYDPELQPAKSYTPSFLEETEYQFRAYTADIILRGEFEFGDRFDLTAFVGATSQTTESRSSFIRANDMVIPGFFDISNGTGTPVTRLDESKKRTYGFFGDATLGYNDYLFLNLAGRYDFTSTLPEDENNYFYPNFGLSFVLSEALKGLKNSNTYMRFTISNSTTYNDLGPYQINETYTQAEGFPYGSLNGFEQSSVAVDPNISKEKINTTEFGANLSFFRNRLTFDAAYFLTKSTDLITYTSPSLTSGSSSVLTNIGEVESTGIELTLGGSVLQSEDWGWDLSVNYTSYESVVKEIADGIEEVAIYIFDLYQYGAGDVGFYAIEGEAFPQIKASSYERDPLGRIVVDGDSGIPVKGDPKKLGKTTPDYILGLTSTFRWKTLSLSATMDYRTGHVFYDFGDDVNLYSGRSPVTTVFNREDFVVPNSVIETSPGIYEENTEVALTNDPFYWIDQYGSIRENYIKDATSFKVRELALNYEIPHKFLSHTGIHRLQVGIIARNYITYFPGDNTFSDPEFQNQTVSENAIGIGGYYQSPPTKSLGFNINIEF
jgi:TonB-linked SusC/RagA family outer membrane protein